MAQRELADRTLTLAKVAGILYLILIACGLSSELLVRAVLIVPGDAAATAANILASPLLFRLGFVGDTIMLLCDVSLAILFYQLFWPAGKTLALLATAFRLLQASVLAVGLLNYQAPLLLLAGDGYPMLFGGAQQPALAAHHLALHSYGYDLGLIFFAISSLCLGYLLATSSYLPRWLGVGLMLSGVVYLTGSMTRFVIPDYYPALQPLYLLPLLAELAVALWLSIRGIRPADREALEGRSLG